MSQGLLHGILPGLADEAGLIAGIDEAGRGCLAGPVVAGAVILPAEYDLPGLTDSKKLSEAARDVLADQIREQAVCWSLGVCRAQVVDQINILQATFRAMARSVIHLKVRPSILLIDGNKTIPVSHFNGAAGYQQEWIIKGDEKIPEISAASILAKTFRDSLMVKLEKRYPGYGFAIHKGYGTKFHMDAVRENGPCLIHRLTFKGVLPEKKKSGQESLCLPGI
ncbi:ribonuclease HII [Maridesulfovibrio ferrireducens]|uniref:ribonuclease HII n=1 Tax=Maridesulfovibrio ferrireducens TaxID=246191 RepID=UPI001A30DC2B|nr:ribonuclease HII [Maridesulfovibrio ferrireducens]MBI9112052.1 ribonuclease HII [Maridesulfovibrio ferrireducens]